jgi:hypothetical protein
MYIILGLLLIGSFIVALRSMKDLAVPPAIIKMLMVKKIRGTIVFFKDQIKRY